VPVKLSNKTPTTLDIMLVADDPGFSFVNARWSSVAGKFAFLDSDTNAATMGHRSTTSRKFVWSTPRKFLGSRSYLTTRLANYFRVADHTELHDVKRVSRDLQKLSR
jgi:hypothetical protein